jgi:hypothetical protein
MDFYFYGVTYVPLIISAIVFYLKVVDMFYNFWWKSVTDAISRFLYVLFFWNASYKLEPENTHWFWLIGAGTVILFCDEIISYFLRKRAYRTLLAKIRDIQF